MRTINEWCLKVLFSLERRLIGFKVSMLLFEGYPYKNKIRGITLKLEENENGIRQEKGERGPSAPK